MLNVFKLATGATLACKQNDKVFGSLSPGRNQTKTLNTSNVSPKPLPSVGRITGIKSYWNQILGLNPVQLLSGNVTLVKFFNNLKSQILHPWSGDTNNIHLIWLLVLLNSIITY